MGDCDQSIRTLANCLRIPCQGGIIRRRKSRIPILHCCPGQGDFRACFKIGRGPAARDFGRGRGGEVRASPQRAVRTEPTKVTAKRTAARRVFAQKALWLRCSSLTDRWRVCSLVSPRQRAFCAKTGPRRILKQALKGFYSKTGREVKNDERRTATPTRRRRTGGKNRSRREPRPVRLRRTTGQSGQRP